MQRGKERPRAGVGVVPTLYLAWFLTWTGTFATTCTGADPESLVAGMIFSVPLYAAGIICLYRGNLGIVGTFLFLPLIVLLLLQAAWGAELYVVVNINGRSACTLMMGDDYGATHGGREYVFAYYYIGISIAAICAIATSFWRHLRTRKASTTAEVFD